jgi:hemerythrin-like domain-containing protein
MSNEQPRNDVFELLLEEHKQLRALLSELSEMLTRRSATIKEATGRLQQLDEQIHVHFQAEEASDCFPELVSNSPRVSERVTNLLAEHGELRAEAHALAEGAAQCKGSAEDWDRLAKAFEQFAAKLLLHERTENELVQEVFTDDIGSKD